MIAINLSFFLFFFLFFFLSLFLSLSLSLSLSFPIHTPGCCSHQSTPPGSALAATCPTIHLNYQSLYGETYYLLHHAWIAVKKKKKNFVSSSEILTSPSMESGRSSMNIRNRIGPSTLPCGIPLNTSAYIDLPPLTITSPSAFFQLENSRLKVVICLGYRMLQLSSEGVDVEPCQRPYGSPGYTTSMLPPSSSMLLQISIISNSCVTQDQPLLKPCWSSLSNDLASRNSISLSLMMDSTSLQMIEVRLTGL